MVICSCNQKQVTPTITQMEEKTMSTEKVATIDVTKEVGKVVKENRK